MRGGSCSAAAPTAVECVDLQPWSAAAPIAAHHASPARGWSTGTWLVVVVVVVEPVIALPECDSRVSCGMQHNVSA